MVGIGSSTHPSARVAEADATLGWGRRGHAGVGNDLRTGGEMVTTRAVSAERLAQAAYLYYVDGLSQEDVAKRIGVSRSNVSRMLTAARNQSIVRFEIAYPVSRNAELEGELVRRFSAAGLAEVLVATTPEIYSDNHVGSVLGICQVCAQWLEGQLFDGLTLGVAWGGTTQVFVDSAHFARRADVHVVHLAGELSLDSRHSGHDLVRNLAEKLGGRYTYFNAPAAAASAEAAQSIMGSLQVSGALQLARAADIAILGVGQFNIGATRLFLEQVGASVEEMAEALGKGVVGQICGRFFDRAGEQVDLAITRRLLSLDLAEIRAIPKVVLLAGGAEKAPATTAALAGGYAKVLITDEPLARAVLREADPPALGRR